MNDAEAVRRLQRGGDSFARMVSSGIDSGPEVSRSLRDSPSTNSIAR